MKSLNVFGPTVEASASAPTIAVLEALHAFPAENKSPGTFNCIKQAEKLGIEVIVHRAEKEVFVRVVSPFAVAGAVFKNEYCIEAAPLLSYCIGKESSWCREYWHKRGWKASIVETNAELMDAK